MLDFKFICCIDELTSLFSVSFMAGAAGMDLLLFFFMVPTGFPNELSDGVALPKDIASFLLLCHRDGETDK